MKEGNVLFFMFKKSLSPEIEYQLGKCIDGEQALVNTVSCFLYVFPCWLQMVF